MKFGKLDTDKLSKQPNHKDVDFLFDVRKLALRRLASSDHI